MPKRVADTPPGTQISETVGSGPFVFRRDLWRPGETLVYEKFKDYKPRAEPPSGLSGGKVVHLDRVEWLAISDPQTAVNALLNGEIDMIEQPVIELLPLLEKDKNIEVIDFNPLGRQIAFRFNTLHKPFDNPKIRQAALYALNQKDFLLAGIGNPKYFKECKAVFICGTPLATDKGFEDKLDSDFAKSKELLKEAGYDGTPVVLLFATDTNTGRLTPIVKSLLERGGFTVDMQAMDWQTVLSRRTRKEPPAAGGWHGFMTAWVSADLLDPVMSAFLGATATRRRSAGRAMPSSRSCATPSPTPPTTPAQGSSPEQVQVRMSGVPDLCSAGPVQHPDGAPHHRHRQPRGAGAGVLEHEEEAVGRVSPVRGW